MNAKIIIKQSSNITWFYSVKSVHGHGLATSMIDYTSQEGAVNGARALIKNMAGQVDIEIEK